MKRSMIVGLGVVAICVLIAPISGDDSVWRRAQIAANAEAAYRMGYRTIRQRQLEEMRLMRQQLARIAQGQAQGANAAQRVAYLEQSVAAYGDNVAGILQAQDQALQQIANDIWGLHERILRLEVGAGLATPPEPPAQQARNPHTID